MKEYSITFRKLLDQQEVDDTLDAALNGCRHWCDMLEVSKPHTTTEDRKLAMSEILTRGGELTFHIDEPFVDEGETKFVLTLEKFLKGIEKYGDPDLENFDGDMADQVLQTALFGEVVYA